ncbi:hypothetical protein TcCL_NonESM09913 [Trypanosoma cruzi]|nr:hypothetical protein TcCL_NonESM09913 [Trypanosoma cruzi]
MPRCHSDVYLRHWLCGASDGAWASLVIVRHVPPKASDASQVYSAVRNIRWVSVPVKVSTTVPDDSRRHCGFTCCCTATLFDGVFDLRLLQLLLGKVGGRGH